MPSSKKLRVQIGPLSLGYCEGDSDVGEGCEVFKSMLTRNIMVFENVCLPNLFFTKKKKGGCASHACTQACMCAHTIFFYFMSKNKSVYKFWLQSSCITEFAYLYFVNFFSDFYLPLLSQDRSPRVKAKK